jgi:hypothetical protein
MIDLKNVSDIDLIMRGAKAALEGQFDLCSAIADELQGRAVQDPARRRVLHRRVEAGD